MNIERPSMSFEIEYKHLLTKYELVWDTISNIMKKGFDIDPINEKKLNTKIKSCCGKIKTDFPDNKGK